MTKFATVGGGPAYRKFLGKAYSTTGELDEWISERLGTTRRTTSDAVPAERE
ncbi:hypothetical protein RB623_09965 [Mesorhizobium sp. LHD-90]|uniref:hypothetical protein n=1 Tax=Mesorhizobium sp. LHD-90 TaxID=3071414 RepID=UPI0027E1A2DB|nr:hypothetical protein [Mesorhizobium sp. LHD-90]MDQ6434373.1 hypothetical protein [Mesorhizobium sp. LHD-90]